MITELPVDDDNRLGIQDKLWADATSLVDDLDRSFLGSFACDRSFLIWAFAVRKQDDDSFVIRQTKQAMTQPGTQYFVPVTSPAAILALDERAFWLQYEQLTQEQFPVPQVTQDISRAASHALRRVLYSRTHLLPYFEAGIWDEAFIDRCIADGIDANVAASMGGIHNHE